MPTSTRIAFLSTPSLYFSIDTDHRNNSFLFDYDDKWISDRGFVHYDFKEPVAFPPELSQSFDLIVIDPPFITEEVWLKYSTTAKALMRSSGCKRSWKLII
jgi:EEF1A lysine methyltransferase 1